MPSNSPPAVLPPSSVSTFSPAVNFSHRSHSNIGIENDEGGGGRSNPLTPTRDSSASAVPFSSAASMLHEVMHNASTSTSNISTSVDNHMPSTFSRSVHSGKQLGLSYIQDINPPV